MPDSLRLSRGLFGALGLTLLVSACTTTRVEPPAPVEDRRALSAPRPALPPVELPAPLPSMAASTPLPGAENAGKAGYHTVRPGDTLIRIGLEHGQNWRDIVRWNNIENPSRIEIGQVLRVMPPAALGSSPASASASGATTAPVTTTGMVSRPLSPAATPLPASTAPTPAPVRPPAATDEGDVRFIWPAAGSVVAGFDDQKNKGLGIAGKAGDAVVAAADGRVVYAGSGLRGYGNLIILKHNNTYLTAYAHNQALLVKEDQNVKQGQKIAEMGSSDADRVKLHFEIRRQGKPTDPAKLLPSR